MDRVCASLQHPLVIALARPAMVKFVFLFSWLVNNDPNECTTCQNTNVLKILNSGPERGICQVSCDFGFYADAQRICRQCQSPCQNCQNSASNCLTCASGVLHQNQCLSNCPSGTFNYNGVCQNCLQGCASCTSGSLCNSCANGYFLTSSSTSVASCPVGLIPDPVTRICCYSTCASCSSWAPNTCNSCSGLRGLHTN